jgi:hypothetical protein
VRFDGSDRYLGEAGDLVNVTAHPVMEEEHGSSGLAEAVHMSKNERVSSAPIDIDTRIYLDGRFGTGERSIAWHTEKRPGAPKDVDGSVSGKAVKPGRELAVAAKGVELSVNGNEDFLDEILGLVLDRRTEGRCNKPEYPVFVTLNQYPKELVITRSEIFCDDLGIVTYPVGRGRCRAHQRLTPRELRRNVHPHPIQSPFVGTENFLER